MKIGIIKFYDGMTDFGGNSLPNLSTVNTVTESDLRNMRLNEMISIQEPPYFRILRTNCGWLYNFWDVKADNYSTSWVFVPEKIL